MENGALKCWGDNGRGQLGLGDSRPRGFVPTDMGRNLPFVNLGRLYKTKKISAGHNYTCALLDSNHVKCWGTGMYGKLGNGNNLDDVGTDPSHMGDDLLPIRFQY
jgi:alpha-tubulin suppressor-like RCC1 family protein